MNIRTRRMCKDKERNDDKPAEVLNYSYTASTDVGLVRTANEDVFLHESTVNGELFVVCDGMGGHSRGKLAAKTAAKQVHALLETQFFEDIFFGLKTAIIFANQEIASLNHNKIEFKRMGTTVVSALIRNSHFYFAHVGDSRIYLLRQGTLYPLTRDHTYVQQLVDAGIISANEALSHPQRNQLTQAVGIQYEVQPTVATTPVECVPNDLFLLCTDGVTDMVSDEQIQAILADTTLELLEVNEALIELAKENGGEDNLTSMLIRINTP